MTRLMLLLCLGTCGLLCKGQHDVAAHFPGGDHAYTSYLEQNLVFPKAALASKSSREIRVLVQIDTQGFVHIQNFIFPNSGLGFEDEVRLFIDQMPMWDCAVHNGVKSVSQMVLNFQFNYVDPVANLKTAQYEYYMESETPVSFVGGLDSIKSFITQMFRDTFDLKFDTTKATIQFVIGADGKVIDAKVLASDNKVDDDYWIYTVRSLPNCIPGRIQNKPVNVQSELSVTVFDTADSDN